MCVGVCVLCICCILVHLFQRAFMHLSVYFRERYFVSWCRKQKCVTPRVCSHIVTPEKSSGVGMFDVAVIKDVILSNLK